MTRSRGLAVVVLLAVSSLLTLGLMGVSQWIQAILVIAVELCLGAVVHTLIEGNRGAGISPSPRHRPGHRPPPRRRKATAAPGHPAADRIDDAAYRPECRLLLPLRGDRPELVAYAIRECRTHRAELEILFVRVMAALPMSPSFAPCEADDDEARAVIGSARRQAERVGVPSRSSYAVGHHPAAVILERAAAGEIDFVVMAAPRRGRRGLVSKLLARDEVRAVLDALPEHVGLLVHA